jgi:tetratricopeptide (TPR) repeat protein
MLRPISGAMLLQVILLALTNTAIAAPQSTASSAPSPTQPTLQQLFDQASAAQEKRNCETALPIFDHLAADPRVKPGSIPAGAIALRRGDCLFVRRKFAESEEQIRIGLPILQKGGPSYAADVGQGELDLGSIAMDRWDHDGAVSHFSAASDVLQDANRINPLIKLAQVTAFDGGDQPLAYVIEALRIASAQTKPDRQTLATIHTVHGRILMNQGRNKEALAELKQALSLSGGLTDRVNLGQVSIRGDLGEAALLNGDKEQARLYLAYTGAGRIQESPFAVAKSMAPPQCGPETGLTPTDSAIVEFGIDDNGDVAAAQTVYTRGNYAVAAAFARAVEQWFWHPADLAKIPAFYRVLTRIEVRCSNSGGRLPSIMSPLQLRFTNWARPYLGDIDVDVTKMGHGLEALAELAKKRESEDNLSAVVAALTARDILDPRPSLGLIDGFDRAITLAEKAQLPDEIINTIKVFRYATVAQLPRTARAQLANRRIGMDARLTIDAAMSHDALAQDTLLLIATPSEYDVRQRLDAMATLTLVADDPRLAEHHPLRQVALLRLANLSAVNGKMQEAQAFFSRTGLTEEQCALIGVTPAMKSSGASSADFPMEALRYGFEGWVNLEFDINANGATANARPVIAYPPFVFVEAATGMAKNIRYQASYRPSGSTVCSANRQTIKFGIPSNH